jgi:hypothetical protein
MHFGPLKPVTLEAERNDSKAVASADSKNVAIFGSITIVPVNWNPGRHELARTLFEILSFRPVRTRTQILVWNSQPGATTRSVRLRPQWNAGRNHSDLRALAHVTQRRMRRESIDIWGIEAPAACSFTPITSLDRCMAGQ